MTLYDFAYFIIFYFIWLISFHVYFFAFLDFVSWHLIALMNCISHDFISFHFFPSFIFPSCFLNFILLAVLNFVPLIWFRYICYDATTGQVNRKMWSATASPQSVLKNEQTFLIASIGRDGKELYLQPFASRVSDLPCLSVARRLRGQYNKLSMPRQKPGSLLSLLVGVKMPQGGGVVVVVVVFGGGGWRWCGGGVGGC